MGVFGALLQADNEGSYVIGGDNGHVAVIAKEIDKIAHA